MISNRLSIFWVLFSAFLVHSSCTDQVQQDGEKPHSGSPKLVVGIIVDQMRYDYLYRFQNRYRDHGLKRMLHEGISMENHHFSYMPTYTGPGHASIYTGTTPAVHGIIANDFYDKVNQQFMYCVQDDSVDVLGADQDKEKRSPKNLLVNTLGDQMKLHFPGSKVISVSIKDRAAILPGGHMADGAYWFNSEEGKFVTTSYYVDRMPDWMEAFNAKGYPDKYLSTPWNTMYPLETYSHSNPDNSPYERSLKKGADPVFPYDLPSIKEESGYGVLKYTPYGNDLVAEAAMVAIDAENLGADEVPDLLAVSFSSTDYVGHAFGTHSVELEDTYLRFDSTLAVFFSFLDSKVGKGNYLAFLTADHGVAMVPQELIDHGIPVGYYDEEGLEQSVKALLEAKFGGSDLLLSYSNNQFFFDHDLAKSLGLDLHEIMHPVMHHVMQFDGVYSVLSRKDLMHKSFPEKINRQVQKGWNPRRSGDIAVVWQPGWITKSYGQKGTTHGSPWSYDTHVPMLFMGWGIGRGKFADCSHAEDIVPTVSVLLGIEPPIGATGEPILSVYGNEPKK